MLTQPRSPEFLHSLAELHRVFSATEHGDRLAQQVRFERYKLPETTNEQWINLLGADVNNLQHMPLTTGLTRDFIGRFNDRIESRPQPTAKISEEQAQLLCLTAMTHDWGESVLGDSTYDHAGTTKVAEKQAVTDIIQSLPLARNLDFYSRINAAKEIVFDSSSHLGRIFNTIERVGYMRTALHAAHHARSGSLPQNTNGLLWLTENVLGNQVSELVDRAEEFPPVFDYLTVMSGAIHGAFEIVTEHPSTHSMYPSAEEQTQKYKQFKDAQLAFVDWHDLRS